jgi:hypothetical protein
METFDMEVKNLLKQNVMTTPDSIKVRIDQTLASLPEKKHVKKKPKWRHLVVAVSVLTILGISITATADLTNTGKEIEYIQKEHPYVVLDSHFYKATGETVSNSQLGSVVGSVKRSSGDGNDLLKNGDSAYFSVGDPIYELNGVDSKTKLAIKSTTGGIRIFSETRYFVLEQAGKVANPDPKTILGSKGDAGELAIVMQNIRSLNPHLYEPKGMGERIFVVAADYHPVFRKGYKNGTNIEYRIPEADTADGVQGFLFVREFSRVIKYDVASDVFSSNYKPTLKEEFDLNGLHWRYYGNNLYLGEKDGYYYELNLQGKMNMEDLIQHFKLTEKN